MATKKTAHRASSATPGRSQRQLRVGEEIRHALARIFESGDLRDPALHDVSLTVTEVRVSPDLKHATAFVMPLGGRNVAATLEGLERGAPYLRREVARAVMLRLAPTLSFELDRSFDEAGRIETLLRQEKVQRDLAGDGDDDGA